MMKNIDIQRLIDLVNDKLSRPITREEAIADLMAAGIVDENGEFTEPYRDLGKLVSEQNRYNEATEKTDTDDSDCLIPNPVYRPITDLPREV